MILTLLWVFALLPVLIFVLVMGTFGVNYIALERTIAAAAAGACPHCGACLGDQAVREGQATQARAIKAMKQAQPRIRPQQQAEWELRCPRCGQLSFFQPETRRLEIVSAKAVPEPPAASS